MKKQKEKPKTVVKQVKREKPASKQFFSEKIGKYGILIVAAFALILHFQTIFFGYTNCDDDLIISKNDYLSDFSNFTHAFSEPYFGGSYYRPMVIASFVIDANIAGAEPWVYHFFNLIYHIISCIGIVLLFRMLKYTKFIAMVAGLVYAAHPMFTNSISWILGRNDLLVGMFGIYAFIFLIEFLEKKNLAYLVLHGILLMLSAWSKEAGLLIPVVGVIYLWLIRKEKLINPRNLTIAIVWLLVAVIWFFMKSSAVTASPEQGDFAFINIIRNIRQIPEVFARFIVPYHNAVLPTYNNILLIIGLVLIAVIAYLAYSKKDKRDNYLIFGLLWLFLFIFPGLFIIIKGKPDYFDYLDTRMYLPMAGMLIVLIELIPSSFKQFNKTANFAPYIIIIFILSVITLFHSRNYDNIKDFWSSAIKDDPARARFYNQLGVYYMNNSKYDLASKNFMKAIELNPAEASYYSKLGLNLSKQKQTEKALKIFEKGRKIDRYNSELNINLAAAHNELKQYDEAISVLRDALATNKNMATILTNLIISFTGKQQYDSAFKYANIQRQMGNLNGIADTYMQWGVNLYNNGDYAGALEKMQKADEAFPNNPRVLNSLGAIQIVMGMYAEAEKNLLKANQLNPNGIEILSNLTKLYAFNLKDKTKFDYYANEVKKRGGQIPPDFFNQF